MEIKFNNVSFVYNQNTPFAKKALDKINIDIKDGQINGIIGKTGSGKTTLIEMINALIVPTSGNLRLGNTILKKDKKIDNITEIRTKVGLVLANAEENFFNPTVYEEISFGMKYVGLSKEEIDNRVTNSIKMVELDETYLNRNPLDLSNGEMRKVAIAGILASNPEVIIFDEPTMGLDYKSKKNLWSIIRSLKNEHNKTIIISTHDVDMLHKIADYIYVLNDGKIILKGDKYEVFKQEEKLNKYGISVPKVISFANLVLSKKNIKIGYRDEINDLIKDVYRYVK